MAAANQHQIFDDGCWNDVQSTVDILQETILNVGRARATDNARQRGRARAGRVVLISSSAAEEFEIPVDPELLSAGERFADNYPAR